MSCYDKLTPEENQRFVKRYDAEILNAVRKETWFNVLHLHGSKVMFKESADYPVDAFNWHDIDDGPSFEEARGLTDKCFLGGLSHLGTLIRENAEDEIAREVKNAWGHNGHRGVILGPGCVVDPKTPERYLLHIRDCVRNTANEK